MLLNERLCCYSGKKKADSEIDIKSLRRGAPSFSKLVRQVGYSETSCHSLQLLGFLSGVCMLAHHVHGFSLGTLVSSTIQKQPDPKSSCQFRIILFTSLFGDGFNCYDA